MFTIGCHLSSAKGYLKMAEEALYSELAFVLKKKKEEMEPFIIEYIKSKDEEKQPH